MSVRKAISLIKRQEEVRVIIIFGKKVSEDYKRSSFDLKDISINDSENIEIMYDDKVMEIPVKQINKLECKLTYVAFYEDLRVTLFYFK